MGGIGQNILREIHEDDDHSSWREIESNIEPWGQNMEVMDKLLDEFEKQYYDLSETSWEEIHYIKKALWLGYNYSQQQL